jgi:hypothetical protein
MSGWNRSTVDCTASKSNSSRDYDSISIDKVLTVKVGFFALSPWR